MTSALSSRSTLGMDTPQVTAKAKVLGRAVYAGDLKLAGMLHGKVLRSPYGPGGKHHAQPDRGP